MVERYFALYNKKLAIRKVKPNRDKARRPEIAGDSFCRTFGECLAWGFGISCMNGRVHRNDLWMSTPSATKTVARTTVATGKAEINGRNR